MNHEIFPERLNWERTMLNTKTGKGSVFRIGGLLKLLLILSVSGDLFSETNLSSINRTERSAFFYVYLLD